MFRIFCQPVCKGQKIQKQRIHHGGSYPPNWRLAQIGGLGGVPPRLAYDLPSDRRTKKAAAASRFCNRSGRGGLLFNLPLSKPASPERGRLHRFLRAVFRPARAAYTNSERIKSRIMMVMPITAVMPVWHL